MARRDAQQARITEQQIRDTVDAALRATAGRRSAGADFEAATKYDGARQDKIFKLGEHGLGYNADRGTTLNLDKLIKAENAQAVTISIDEALPPRSKPEEVLARRPGPHVRTVRQRSSWQGTRSRG